MQSVCFGVRNRAWPPSITLSRRRSGQPGFKQNQAGDFPPEGDKQQQRRVRESGLPVPSLWVKEFRVFSPVAGVTNPHLVLEGSQILQLNGEDVKAEREILCM